MDSYDPLVSLLILTISLFSALVISYCELLSLTFRKSRIEFDNLQVDPAQRMMAALADQPVPIRYPMLVGKFTFILLFFAALLSLAWNLPVNPVRGLLSTVLMVTGILVIFVFSELLAKTLYHRFYNGISRFWAGAIWLIYLLFYLPSLLTISLVKKVTLLFSGEKSGESEREKHITDTGREPEPDHEITIFRNAMHFSKVKARDCMVPRNEIVAMPLDTDINGLRAKFVDTHFSKILIYRDSTDDIIGYVHSYELFRNPQSVKAMLLPVFIVPETMSASEVFEMFVKQKRSIAVVVDEFGGTAGMITPEDIIEEIFGEIEDEHDTTDFREEQINASTFVFSGRLEIDYLNEKYHLGFPKSEEYDTLAGLILHHLEDIPEPATVLSLEKYELTVTSVADARIDLVRVHLKEAD